MEMVTPSLMTRFINIINLIRMEMEVLNHMEQIVEQDYEEVEEEEALAFDFNFEPLELDWDF